jgi:hypothetical protein
MAGEVDAAWSRSVVQELLDHIARGLAPLLPQHLVLLAAPGQLVLASTTDGLARTVATTSVDLMGHVGPDDLGFVAHRLLDDAQDLVVSHLHRPWPTAPDGAGLYAWSDASDRGIELGFCTQASPGENLLPLPAFVVPDEPGGVRSAG